MLCAHRDVSVTIKIVNIIIIIERYVSILMTSDMVKFTVNRALHNYTAEYYIISIRVQYLVLFLFILPTFLQLFPTLPMHELK